MENNSFPPYLIPFIAAVLAYIFGILTEKFKSRLVFLKRRIIYFPMGTSIQNRYWGKIELKHDERIVNHLSIVTVEIENSSSKNFSNMFMDVWVEANNQILGYMGNYKDTGNAILLEDSYAENYLQVSKRCDENDALKLTDPNHITPSKLLDDVNWVQMNKTFHFPVLNRRSSISISLLVENYRGERPVLHAQILHEGVKIIDEQDKETQNKQLAKGLINWGLVIYSIGTFLLFYRYPGSSYALILATTLGIFYYPVGLLIHVTVKYIRRLFS